MDGFRTVPPPVKVHPGHVVPEAFDISPLDHVDDAVLVISSEAFTTAGEETRYRTMTIPDPPAPPDVVEG